MSKGMLKIFLAVAVILGAASASHAACISEAKLKRQLQPVAEVFSQFQRAGKKDVTIYKRKPNDFVVVERQKHCITSMQVLDNDELSRLYEIEDETDCEECAGVDTKSAVSSQEASVSKADLFPFLFFDQYAIGNVYSGPIAKPDFNRRDKKFATFRTRITEGMKNGVNFSGEYALTEIGCGTSCSVAVLSNIRTGEQFEFPIGGEESGPLSLKYAADSSLLVTSHRDLNSCVLESLLFNGSEWVTLAKPVIGEADMCYDDIDENIARYKKQFDR